MKKGITRIFTAALFAMAVLFFVKVNAFAAMVSHGIHGLHALKLCDMFSDVQEVYEDSKELIDKYQKSLFEKDNSSAGNSSKAVNGDRLMGDESDQISNSPYIDGTGAAR